MLLKKMENLKHQIIEMRNRMDKEPKKTYSLQSYKEKRTKFSLKRGLIVTVLNISLIVSSAVIVAPQSYADTLPTDIQGHWSEPFVTSLVNQGVISGYPDGTFKPDKAISNAEFLSLTLKAMNETVQGANTGETWDMPIMKRAYELGLVKTGEPMTNATSEITREQSAAILYRALEIKEGVEYDQCYTSILDQVIFDHDQIESAYRDSVYSMLQKGVFTGNANHFNAKGLMTRGASCVVIERVLDKSKRANPTKTKNGFRVSVELKEPIESQNSIQMLFENGKPVIDHEKVISELKQHENNTFSGFLYDYYYYDDYINRTWSAPGYDNYEAKKEYADSLISIGIEAMKVFYNYDYRNDMKSYEKSLQWVSATNNPQKNRIEALINSIQSNTLVMESQFVTDKSLFYNSSDGSKRLRGRLYFTFKSPSQKAEMFQTEFEDVVVKLKVDQWYYIDLEAYVGDYGGHSGVEWEHSTPNYASNCYLTDFIPVNPLN